MTVQRLKPVTRHMRLLLSAAHINSTSIQITAKYNSIGYAITFWALSLSFFVRQHDAITYTNMLNLAYFACWSNKLIDTVLWVCILVCLFVGPQLRLWCSSARWPNVQPNVLGTSIYDEYYNVYCHWFNLILQEHSSRSDVISDFHSFNIKKKHRVFCDS